MRGIGGRFFSIKAEPDNVKEVKVFALFFRREGGKNVLAFGILSLSVWTVSTFKSFRSSFKTLLCLSWVNSSTIPNSLFFMFAITCCLCFFVVWLTVGSFVHNTLNLPPHMCSINCYSQLVARTCQILFAIVHWSFFSKCLMQKWKEKS